MNEPQPHARTSLAVKVFGAIGLVIVVVGFALILGTHSPTAAPQAIIPTGPDAAALEAQAAALAGPYHNVMFTWQKAQAVRDALDHADYAQADKLLTDALGKTHIWAQGDFEEIVQAMPTRIPDFTQRMEAWAAKDPSSPYPSIILAQYNFAEAWRARGSRRASETGDSHYATFSDFRKKAIAAADAALNISDKIPYTYLIKLNAIGSEGNSPEAEAAFQDGIKHFPNYYPLYKERLYTLTPKWGGSLDQMVSFVEEYTATGPQYSPLKLLYLELYSNMVDAVSFACFSQDVDVQKRCVTETMPKVLTPRFEDRVQEALDLYSHTDRHEFNLELRPLLSGLVAYRGSEVAFNKLIQMAAKATGSNIELSNPNPGHNNYTIDRAVAESWTRDAYYDNAEKKFKQALDDLANDPYPEEADNLGARVHLYQAMSKMYFSMSQMDNAIVYDLAANKILGGTGSSVTACKAYSKLSRYADAVRECTKVIDDGTGGDEAIYTRGMAYVKLKQYPQAIKDFNLLADSESTWNVSAAISLSVVYGEMKDYQGQLDSMMKHPYLFDEQYGNKENLAVAFNNRCYAYMKLEQLDKALDDCNTSIRYGNIPDAYQKKALLEDKIKARDAAK